MHHPTPVPLNLRQATMERRLIQLYKFPQPAPQPSSNSQGRWQIPAIIWEQPERHQAVVYKECTPPHLRPPQPPIHRLDSIGTTLSPQIESLHQKRPLPCLRLLRAQVCPQPTVYRQECISLALRAITSPRPLPLPHNRSPRSNNSNSSSSRPHRPLHHFRCRRRKRTRSRLEDRERASRIRTRRFG